MSILEWYAVEVAPQKEFTVKEILTRLNFDCFLPVERRWRRRNRYSKQKVRRKFPLLPRYIFVAIGDATPGWHSLFEIDAVMGVVGIDDRPYPIDRAKLFELQKLSNHGEFSPPTEWRFMRSNREFKVGDKVRIVNGPMIDHEVRVLGIEGPKAKILLDIFGGTQEVDIHLDKLESLD